MECSTKGSECQEGVEWPLGHPLVEERWSEALSTLVGSLDLDRSAKQSGALVRKREVKGAADLLRMVLAYAVCDWSLRLMGVWCTLLHLGCLSDVAIRKRLQHCQSWLGQIIMALLDVRHLEVAQQPGVHVRLVDASHVSRPGSRGTDWVIHLSLDLGSGSMDGVEVTDAHSGETLARHALQEGEIRVADRGYAYASSLGPVLAGGGLFVVRSNWQSLPLEREDGSKIQLIAVLQALLPQQALHEQNVWLSTPQGRFRLRLIVGALPQEEADRARQRLHKAYRKKGKTPSQQTLLAAGFTLLVTNLPAEQWPAQHVLALYRLRWQIELLFKRLKSLLYLDHLRAQDPQLAQVYLLGKLLAALLLERLAHQVRTQCPDWFHSLDRPVSAWRLTALLFDTFRSLVRGPLTLTALWQALPQLGRFLRDAPRRRTQQGALARSLLDLLSFC